MEKVIFKHVNLGLEMTIVSLGCAEIFKLAFQRLCSQDSRSHQTPGCSSSLVFKRMANGWRVWQ